MLHRLDPALATIAADLPVRDLTDLAGTRAAVSAAAARLPAPDTTGLSVTEEVVPGGPRVRVYRPERSSTVPTGALLHAHGGGFVMCDLETSHPRAVELVRALGVPLVSVDYRLAPEHPYPAALDDVAAALDWLASTAPAMAVDPERIVLHGTSAGACLVAAAALRARDRGGPAACFQYLGIPVLDDRLTTPSMHEFTEAPQWDAVKAALGWDAYLGAGRRGSDDVPAYAAPARTGDLSGLPPAYISVMECDPLRDEGLEHARRLLDARVPVEVHLFPGTYHGSSMVGHVPVSARERDEEVAVLRAALEREVRR